MDLSQREDLVDLPSCWFGVVLQLKGGTDIYFQLSFRGHVSCSTAMNKETKNPLNLKRKEEKSLKPSFFPYPSLLCKL